MLSYLKSTNAITPILFNSIIEIVNSCKDIDNIPCVYQHGDPICTNILLSEGGECFYLIDFEHSDEYIFFYDIFHFIINLGNNSHHLINKYYSGDYDSEFEEIFNLFSMKYDNNKKTYYIALYSIQYLVNAATRNKDASGIISYFCAHITKILKMSESYQDN